MGSRNAETLLEKQGTQSWQVNVILSACYPEASLELKHERTFPNLAFSLSLFLFMSFLEREESRSLIPLLLEDLDIQTSLGPEGWKQPDDMEVWSKGKFPEATAQTNGDGDFLSSYSQYQHVQEFCHGENDSLQAGPLGAVLNLRTFQDMVSSPE